MKLAAYTLMLLFDAAMLGGFAYLVDQRGWSAWWLAFAAVMMIGSNPQFLWKDRA